MATHHSSFKTEVSGLVNPVSSVNPVKKINVDLIAVTIALTLAALIRFNVIPHIGF